MSVWESIFNPSMFLGSVGSSMVVILAALGCLMTEQTGMMNIGIDGMVITGAFTAAVVSWAAGSWVAGIAAAMAVGLLLGLFYGVMVIHLRSDEFIVGMALNIFCVALTTFLLRTMFPGQKGSFHPAGGDPMPIPVIRFGGEAGALSLSLMAPVALVLVALCQLFLYRTPAGFWLRASGEHPDSLRSVGRSPDRMKYIGALACGFFCGLAGAYLSMADSNTFSENMTDGRGYVAVACVIFGRANPLIVTLAALFFGFIRSASMPLQTLGIVDGTLTGALPHAGTILMMIVLAIRETLRRRIRHRAEATPQPPA